MTAHHHSEIDAAAALWLTVFGNLHPVAIEIGPGRGEFLLAQARAHPERNLFGIERSAARASAIERRLEAARLPNARIVNGDATCIMGLLPDACVATYYVQFPDPWWKRRHHRRRLFTAAWVATLRRTLEPGGTIELVTDVAEYFTLARGFLDRDPGFELIATGLTTDACTSFARKAVNRGAALYRSVHRRR